MDMHMLTSFFMRCTIINFGLLLFLASIYMFAGDLVYRSQLRWFDVPEETFSVAFYSFIGLFKVLVLVFFAVPWIALPVTGQGV